MPRLWSETIDAHRRQVRETILDTTADLVATQGLLNVTMSQVAEQSGIGRATLYKYFASVDEILRTWHERQVAHHLDLLTEIAGRDAPAFERLASMLDAYAHIQRRRLRHGTGPHGGELTTFLHRDGQLAPAEQALRDLLRTVLTDAAADGQVRSDTSCDELAAYCLHALDAAGCLGSKPAEQRLVALVLDGLRPPA